MKKLQILFPIFVLVFLATSTLNSCPCGCGATVATGIQTGEAGKVSLSQTREFDKEVVLSDGSRGMDDGPTFTDQTQFGFVAQMAELPSFLNNYDGLSINGRFGFQTQSQPVAGQNTAATDPVFGLRANIIEPSITSTFPPQLDFVLSYKYPLSPSGDDVDEIDENMINVHGNGYKEWTIGLDSWFALGALDLGLGQFVVFSETRGSQFGPFRLTKKQGNIYKTDFSVSKIWFAKGQILATLQREYKEADYFSGEIVEGSQRQRLNLTLTTNMRIADQQMLGVTLFRAGINDAVANLSSLTQNKNASSFSSIGISYSRNFIAN